MIKGFKDYGRKTKRDYANFLLMARGSAFEIETQLLLCIRVGYLAEKDIGQALALLSETGKMINAIVIKLRNEENSPSP